MVSLQIRKGPTETLCLSRPLVSPFSHWDRGNAIWWPQKKQGTSRTTFTLIYKCLRKVGQDVECWKQLLLATLHQEHSDPSVCNHFRQCRNAFLAIACNSTRGIAVYQGRKGNPVVSLCYISVVRPSFSPPAMQDSTQTR
uniref:Uncharacterized protein n=1 Tax=Eutreptiella gymnastica TaxID=73025 RepID=A0A7S1N6V2_9EUGL